MKAVLKKNMASLIFSALLYPASRANALIYPDKVSPVNKNNINHIPTRRRSYSNIKISISH